MGVASLLSQQDMREVVAGCCGDPCSCHLGAGTLAPDQDEKVGVAWVECSSVADDDVVVDAAIVAESAFRL